MKYQPDLKDLCFLWTVSDLNRNSVTANAESITSRMFQKFERTMSPTDAYTAIIRLQGTGYLRHSHVEDNVLITDEGTHALQHAFTLRGSNPEDYKQKTAHSQFPFAR